MRNLPVTRIETSERLDAWSSTIRPVVARLVGEGRRRDLLTGRWAGHPFHPAAVLAPLGCWIGAAVTDASGGAGAERAARRLVGAGVVAAAPALASGAAGWLDTRQAEQRVGTVHAIANHVALALMAASWGARRRGHHQAGVALSTLGLGGAMAAGWLGGHLAYARGVGVSTTAFQAGPTDWTPLMPAGELVDGKPTEATRDGVGYVAVADGPEVVHVLENRCTHRGGPLAKGSVIDGCIECPWHASRFSLRDGRVMAGPASIDQPAYETRVVSGQVEIRRPEPGGLRQSSVQPSSVSE